jgi:hypothetical protein
MYESFEEWRKFMPRDYNGTLVVRPPKPAPPPLTDVERLVAFQNKLRVQRSLFLWATSVARPDNPPQLVWCHNTRLCVLRGDKMVPLGVGSLWVSKGSTHPYDHMKVIGLDDKVGLTFEEVGLTDEDRKNLWHIPTRVRLPVKVTLPA